MKSSQRLSLAFVALATLALSGCSGGDNNSASDDVAVQDASANNGVADMGFDEPDAVDSSDVSSADLGDAADATTEDAAVEPDMGPALMESEPNDGTTLEEVDDLPVGQTIEGAVDVDDGDVFHVLTTPGTLYEVALTPTGSSPLQGHVTVIDDGRDGDAAGGDYVKISRDGSLRFLAMGDGGYYVAVRDARNVDGGGAGGADHTYSLRVEERPVSDAVRGTVEFGNALTGSLAGAGDVHLWTFEGVEGTDVRFDFSTSGDLDGRLYVFSEQTGSWIARQDDRTASDPNPLLDAPLTASGNMMLVVENIADEATSFAYSINASTP